MTRAEAIQFFQGLSQSWAGMVLSSSAEFQQNDQETESALRALGVTDEELQSCR